VRRVQPASGSGDEPGDRELVPAARRHELDQPDGEQFRDVFDEDPRLSGLLGNVNSSAATAKVADQLCAALGGGCRPAFSEQQVAAAADRLSPAQKTAVSDNFMTSLNSLTSNPALRDSVSRALGARMSGIVGAVV
jgi:hypothetical protein